MNHDDCYYLGRITKPWGTKGQMALFLDVDNPDEYRNLDSAFVDIRGTLVPHFFTLDNLNGNRAVVTFEDLDAPAAQALAGHDLYLPLSLLPKLTGNNFYFHEVVGYTVVDATYGNIGTLAQVIDYPAQPLFQVLKDGTEILIPAVDPIIQRLDRETKTLFLDIPNGLIDLYLGNMNNNG